MYTVIAKHHVLTSKSKSIKKVNANTLMFHSQIANTLMPMPCKKKVILGESHCESGTCSRHVSAPHSHSAWSFEAWTLRRAGRPGRKVGNASEPRPSPAEVSAAQ